MKKIGLTGGIAAGKSTVSAHWQQAGAVVIESDLLAHRAYEPNTATYAEVVEVFGQEVLNPDQTINRRTLGEIVFADDQKRLALNRVVHPAVRVMWTEQLEQLERAGQTAVAVAAIPLLYEVGAESQFDWVVAVGCSEPTQLARLAAKGMTAAHAQARIRSQWPLQMKMDRADFVIWNDGQLEWLHQQAGVIWEKIKESSHAPSKS